MSGPVGDPTPSTSAAAPTAVPDSAVKQCVEQLLKENPNLKYQFEWKPPELTMRTKLKRIPDAPKVAQGATAGSTSTRAPAFYDKHFDPRLVLVHVDRYPEMTRDLVTNLDRLLARVHQDERGVFPSDNSLPSPDAWDAQVSRIDNSADKEIAVQQTYSLICTNWLLIASSLLFHPNYPVYYSLLAWTSDGTASGYAIADGVINLRSSPPGGDWKTKYDKCWEHLSEYNEKRHKLLKFMSRSEHVASRDLAVWELKSITVGTPKKMEAVLDYFCGKRFHWELCEYGRVYCMSKHSLGRNQVALIFRGADGRDGVRYRLPEEASATDLSRSSTLQSFNAGDSLSSQTQVSVDWENMEVDTEPDSPESEDTARVDRAAERLRILREAEAMVGLEERHAVEGPAGPLPPSQAPIHDIMVPHMGTGRLHDPLDGEEEEPYRRLSLPPEDEFPDNRTIGTATIDILQTARLSDARVDAHGISNTGALVVDNPSHVSSAVPGPSTAAPQPQTESLQEDPPPPKRRYKYPPRAGRAEIPGDPALPGKRQKALTMRYVIQQAWAQAVRSDCTFLIISSGNHEFIGIRHRAKQTLFLSELIRPPSFEEYGKLQVALFVAIMQDAMERRQQNHNLDASHGYPTPDDADFAGAVSTLDEPAAEAKKKIAQEEARERAIETKKEARAEARQAKEEEKERKRVAAAKVKEEKALAAAKAKEQRAKTQAAKKKKPANRKPAKGKGKAKAKDETDDENANGSGSDGGRPGPSRKPDDDDDSDGDGDVAGAGRKRPAGNRASKTIAPQKRRKMNDSGASTTAATNGHAGGTRRAASPPRTRNAVRREKAVFQNVHAEALLRHTVCLSLCYDLYDSVYPAVFTRIGAGTRLDAPVPKATMKKVLIEEDSSNHLRITLTSEVGRGLLGIAHGGFLELPNYQNTSEPSPPIKVVAKIALTPASRAGLKIEHAVYGELHVAGVQGIPTLFGLFEDKEDEAHTLVMTYGGTCFTPGVPVTGQQYEAFLKTLRAIHQAGFVHNDLRPANLLVDENGNVCIIDFHCSRKTIHETRKAAEMDILRKILNGNWTEDDESS